MVKNSNSVDVYMVIILLDTKVTVNQPITNTLIRTKIIMYLKHFFPFFYLLNNSTNLIDCWKNYSRT